MEIWRNGVEISSRMFIQIGKLNNSRNIYFYFIKNIRLFWMASQKKISFLSNRSTIY